MSYENEDVKMLEFDGVQYPTIVDVKQRFRVSEKTIRNRIKDGTVPEPPVVQIGARKFRHFTEEWQQQFQASLSS